MWPQLSMTGGNLALLVAALILAGAIVGFMSGLLGIGGGGILVPVLYETFTALNVEPEIRMHMALATSLWDIPCDNRKKRNRWPMARLIADSDFFVCITISCVG